MSFMVHSRTGGAAWKVCDTLSPLSGVQSVPYSYPESIECGDRLTLLPQWETLIDATEVQNSADWFVDFWKSVANTETFPKEIPASAIITFVFAHAYHADAIYTSNHKVVALLNHVESVGGPSMKIISAGAVSISDLLEKLEGRHTLREFLLFDAFARKFGELSHLFFSTTSVIDSAREMTFSGSLTLQPAFNARFSVSSKPMQSNVSIDIAGAVTGSQIVVGTGASGTVHNRSEVDSTLLNALSAIVARQHLNEDGLRQLCATIGEVKSVLITERASVQDISANVAAILKKVPASRPLWEELLMGVTSSVWASNILAAIRLALGA
jgi:hypothetical protein